LQDSKPERAAGLLADMEPDEAISRRSTLRDLPEGRRQDLLGVMAPEVAGQLADLLGYREARAGGVMTNIVVATTEIDTVGEAIARLRAAAEHSLDLAAQRQVGELKRLLDPGRRSAAALRPAQAQNPAAGHGHRRRLPRLRQDPHRRRTSGGCYRLNNRATANMDDAVISIHHVRGLSPAMEARPPVDAMRLLPHSTVPTRSAAAPALAIATRRYPA
jgi:pyruvate/2-oxoglutarate dehydrogenase complex dihydrolipoamide acyltransferase (E2) component